MTWWEKLAYQFFRAMFKAYFDEQRERQKASDELPLPQDIGHTAGMRAAVERRVSADPGLGGPSGRPSGGS